jgi:hypothetical protein
MCVCVCVCVCVVCVCVCVCVCVTVCVRAHERAYAAWPLPDLGTQGRNMCARVPPSTPCLSIYVRMSDRSACLFMIVSLQCARSSHTIYLHMSAYAAL